jgi:outer membrane protein OmpA-like peptidoglycan-associated protein
MRKIRLTAVIMTAFMFSVSQAQVGDYFSKFRPSKKWSVGLQIAPTMMNGDADDYSVSLAGGVHAKYSFGQSFGLKLSGNMGSLKGGRMDPDFSQSKSDGTTGATNVIDQQNGMYNGGVAVSYPEDYTFVNNYMDVDLTAVYTLGNLSFLRPLRKIQMFAFFGVGNVWSDVEGTFGENGDPWQDIFGQYGPAYIEPYDAAGNQITGLTPMNNGRWDNTNVATGKTYYKGSDLTIPFGAGLKRNFGKWLDLGLEWKTYWTRNDNLDGYSFPDWRNRSFDYYTTLGIQASIKLGKKGMEKHYDWLNPMETIYSDLDSLKNDVERLKPLLDDADGDGVSDYYDKEADTDEDCDKVYGNGVSVDSDGDGISDCKDAEPFSECADNVDENGVAIDTDGDGVPDCLDEQNDTPDGSLVDVRGVGFDINESCCDCENISLPSIIFDNGSSKISASTYGILYAIAEKMKSCPELTITAVGYSNSKASEQLAWKRANAIVDHLESNYGIDRSRVSVDYSSDSSGDYSRRRIDLGKGSGGNSAPPAPGM